MKVDNSDFEMNGPEWTTLTLTNSGYSIPSQSGNFSWCFEILTVSVWIVRFNGIMPANDCF